MIVGPTASGKSALALELAKKQALENRESVIINADSAQVYRDLQVLSARPREEEMEGIPHHLYGYIDGADACSAARWAKDARKEIDSAHQKGILPILVGGTGMYVQTLIFGISPIPRIDENVRREVRALGTSDAYSKLQDEDPVSAKRLNPRDTTRIMRALEVIRSTGKPLDHWHQQRTGGIGIDIRLYPLILMPPREWLYERCDRRFRQMMDQGAREEVEALLARQLPDDCPVMRAIGVREIADWINGDIGLEEAITRAQAATRQYAKRQYTWFRNQFPSAWPKTEMNINNDNINDIVRLLQ
ncbi:tRNA dimethylallyltransferase [hydrothermal vent metagenome]|uniref:tRNA dimethylallyltransferase n=1 Tax=hydrothermal vent metagenome TaxID=652676 RepID=A0A3B0S445_9ZZZZ